MLEEALTVSINLTYSQIMVKFLVSCSRMLLICGSYIQDTCMTICCLGRCIQKIRNHSQPTQIRHSVSTKLLNGCT